MIPALVAAVLALALLAPPAFASEARIVPVLVERCGGEGECHAPRETMLVYEDRSRTANRLTVRREPRAIELADPAATIRPGRGCRPSGPHVVHCRLPQQGIFVSLGDGADRIAIAAPAPQVMADGGRGADLLAGGPGHDRLHGGRGRDVLLGGAGFDELYDAALTAPPGAGEPSPFEGPVPLRPRSRGERDLFDGGPGRDRVSFEGRRSGVRADLGGAGRSEDALRSLESATGGDGPDRLAGSAAGNQLEGGDGADRLAGRAGRDVLSGGAGADVASGGPGRDNINPLDERGTRERISCGADLDRASGVGPRDLVSPDCERLGLQGLPLGPDVRSLLPLRPGVRPDVLRVTLGCFAEPSCTARVAMRVAGTAPGGMSDPPLGALLAEQELALDAPERRDLTLTLSPDGATLLRRHRALRVRVEMTEQWGGLSGRAGYLTLLRRPG